jgi:histidine phosphotransferase ChpT
MGIHPTQTTHQGMQLAESLCARLCHDMSGPLGTVTGALELALDDPDSAVESLQLAQEASTQMVMRLRLSRAAWAGDCGPLDASGLAELARGLPARVNLDCAGLTGRFPPQMARVLINMLLLAVDALPRGGTISLSGAPESEVVLTVAGADAAWPAGLPLALTAPHEAKLDEPLAVQAPLAAMLAQAAGLRLSLLFAATGGDNCVAPLLLGKP